MNRALLVYAPAVRVIFCSLVLFSCRANHSPESLVNVNLKDLAYFAQKKPDVLKRQLLSLPDWTSKEDWNDGLVFLKLDSTKEVRTPFGTGGGVSIFHPEYVFRFTKKLRREYGARDSVTTVNPTAGPVYLRVTSSYGSMNSTLRVGENGLWFQFFEGTGRKERGQTRDALRCAETFLAQVRAAESEIEEKGFAERLTPPESVKRGTPSFDLETISLDPEAAVSQTSFHKVNAWVNAGEFGYAYMRAFNEETGKEMGPFISTRKYMAWSKDSGWVFPYKTDVSVRAGASYGQYKARFELWFHPSNGDPERKLFGKTFLIQGWYK